MPHTRTDDIRIWYETLGDSSGEPIVLVEGTGAQLIATPLGFCDLLVAEGFFVIRFDNRDTGMSQRFGGPEDLDGGYGLSDMAGDILRVLDDLGIASAHVAGWSMGGMMAQVLAIEHPERLRSMTLFFTIPGKEDPRYFPDGTGRNPALEVVPPRLSRAEQIELSIAMMRAHTPPDEFDPAADGEIAGLAYDRGYAPDGVVRQWTALRRAPERLELLRAVRAPSLVVHGRDDLLLRWQASVDIAEAVPGSELHIVPGMGHRMPQALWPTFVAAIARTARRYEGRFEDGLARPPREQRDDG